MKTVSREQGESIDALVRRCYTVRWIDGLEDEGRVERAASAVVEANPDVEVDAGRDAERDEVNLPELAGIPYLETLIDETAELHRAIHEALERIKDNDPLMLLSFIDPIRLGCEELGIGVTPQVADEVHRRLEGVLSFDQERYVEVRERGGPLHGIHNIRWVTR